MGLIQQNSGTFTGSSFTATLPGATATSNTVYVIVAGNTIINTPASWTLRTSQVNQMGHYLYSRTGVALSSIAFTNSAGQGTWWAFEVNGAYDTSTSANNAADATTYATPSLTPTAGTRSILASIGSLHVSSSVRTVSGWTNSFIEQIDLCQASADYPMQGGALLADITANGSTAYNTTATYSMGSIGKSAIILSSASTAGGGGPTPVAGAETFTLTDASTEAATDAGVEAFTLTDTAAEAATAASSDAGALTDTSATLQARTIIDTGTVSDASSEAATLGSSEAATVTETVTAAATSSSADAGALTDTTAALASTDTGTDSSTLADSSAVVVGGLTLASSDAGTFTEQTSTLAASTGSTEAGALAEAGALGATDTGTDSWALTDAGTVLVGGLTVASADSWALAEARTLTATLGATDAALVAELVQLAAVAAAVSDTAVQSDASAVTASAQPASVDAGGLVESVQLVAALAVVEQLTHTEQVLALVAALAGADQATLTDLGVASLPAADVPPILLHAAGKDGRWRAVGRVLARYAAAGRGGRYAAHGHD